MALFRRQRPQRRRRKQEKPKPETIVRPAKPVTREDLRGPALNRWLWKYSLQHPATILPAAVAAVALFYGTLIEFSPAALAVSIVAGAAGVLSWGVNYFLRGIDLVKKRQAALQQQLARQEVARVHDIAGQCSQAGFELGAKEARELTSAYEKLLSFLDSRDRDDLGAVQFRTLAKSTYQQGIAILKRALSLHRVVCTVDVGQLERELAQFKIQRAHLAQDPAKTAELEAQEQMIATHKRRLEQVRKQQKEILILISRSNELEGALETSRLRIAGLEGASGPLSTGGAAESLQAAVEAARRTEASLGAMGDLSDRDRELEELGQKTTDRSDAPDVP